MAAKKKRGNLAMTAARMVRAGTHTQSAAARHVGVSRQAVFRALERLAKREGTAAPAPEAG